MKSEQTYLILILDEVSVLSQKDIRGFIHLSEEYGSDHRISLIMISRPTEWKIMLSSMVSQRISDVVQFYPYSFAETHDILKYRAHLAFKSSALSEEILDMITEISHQTKNLRHGIETLYRAGRGADQKQLNEITPELIRRGKNDVFPEMRPEILEELKTHELFAALGIARRLNHKGITAMWIFPSITAENPNSAAIRVFLDLISRSQEGSSVLKNINVITAKSMRLMKEKEVQMSLNWGTGAYPSMEGLVTGMLDGIISVKHKNKHIAEFIVEMIGERKAKLRTAAMFSSGPLSNVLADILRIAVFGSAGIPGFVVIGEINKNNLIYTLIYFDQIVLDNLRLEGANLAVNFNRPVVKEIIEEFGIKKIISLYQKVFKTIKVSAFPEDPYKFTTSKYSTKTIYSIYLKLLKIIVGKRDFD